MPSCNGMGDVLQDLENARVIFEKATKVNYKTVDDLAALWCVKP